MKCLKYSVNPHSYRITKPGYRRKSGMGFFSCGSNSLIASHLCIVEQVENSKIYTIEGHGTAEQLPCGVCGDFGIWKFSHSIILCFLPLLAFIQNPEPASRSFQQLVESALLHHAAILHHQNAVSVLDGGQAMGHGNDGPVCGNPVQALLDFPLCLGVQGGGGLV